MSVVIVEDCVRDEDGTFVCWDAEKRCFYRLSAKKEAAEDISHKTLGRLVELLGARKAKPDGA